MRKLKYLVAALTLVFLSCKKEDNIVEKTQQTSEKEGYNMLLIGNSFFKPYTEKLDVMAADAGIVNHNSTTVFRGGENGRPINFWNDSTSAENQQIKSILDQGNVEYFGMTFGRL